MLGISGGALYVLTEPLHLPVRPNPIPKMRGKGKLETHILRQACADFLPAEVPAPQKHQFSEGVGYNWIDTIKEIAGHKVTDEQMANVHLRFPINPPLTKEEYVYRSIFSELFPSDCAAQCVPSVPSVACSSPVALEWDEAFRKNADPSGRAVGAVHDHGYK